MYSGLIPGPSKDGALSPGAWDQLSSVGCTVYLGYTLNWSGPGRLMRILGPKLQASEDSTANSTRGRVAEPEASSAKQQATSSLTRKDYRIIKDIC